MDITSLLRFSIQGCLLDCMDTIIICGVFYEPCVEGVNTDVPVGAVREARLISRVEHKTTGTRGGGKTFAGCTRWKEAPSKEDLLHASPCR